MAQVSRARRASVARNECLSMDWGFRGLGFWGLGV